MRVFFVDVKEPTTKPCEAANTNRAKPVLISNSLTRQVKVGSIFQYMKWVRETFSEIEWQSQLIIKPAGSQAVCLFSGEYYALDPRVQQFKSAKQSHLLTRFKG